MSGSTPNYGLILPTVTGDTGAWGGYLNSNFTSLDSIIHGVANPANLIANSTPGTSVKGTLTFQNSAAPGGQQVRWVLAEDTAVESGGNVGSNFSLGAYSDAGALIFTPMSFTRSTGAVAFSGSASFAQGIAVTGVATSKGVTDGSNAAAGQVGEYLTASAGPTGFAWLTPLNAASLALTAGDWDVWGSFNMAGAAGTLLTAYTASLSLVSATLGATFVSILTPAYPSGANLSAAIPRIRVNVSSSTTVYGVVNFNGSGGGSPTVAGTINARRVR